MYSYLSRGRSLTLWPFSLMTLVWWRSSEILVSRFTALGTFLYYIKTFLRTYLAVFWSIAYRKPDGIFAQLDI